MPSKRELREVARQLRLISQLTEDLRDDSPPDAALRDRTWVGRWKSMQPIWSVA